MEFDMVRADWVKDYPDLVELLSKADPTVVQAWPNSDFGTGEDGLPLAMTVRIEPLGARLLRQQPREVRRQMTVNGRRVDLRSERAHMIVTPPVENLIIMAHIWMKRLETEQDQRAWRANRLNLERLLTYRGHELPLALKDDVIKALDKYPKPLAGKTEPNADVGS